MSSSRISFSSLGSGSKGNATLVRSGKTLVLIDCGFTLKEATRRLGQQGVDPYQLTAVLVTHEHGDHIGGVGALCRRYKLPLYTTPGTRLSGRLGKIDDWRKIDPEHPFAIGDLEVWPVTVPHDAREPVQFILGDGDRRLGLLTDLGCITPHVLRHYRRCQGLILEANHDPQLLAQGPYPASLKKRVAGDYGHLSNQQAAELLQQLDARQLQHLIASHLSEQNNCPNLAQETLAAGLNCASEWVTLADQETGFDWRQLA